jgi:hypothetical protein
VSGSNKRLTLVATILGSSIAILDSSVVSVALPSIQRSLRTQQPNAARDDGHMDRPDLDSRRMPVRRRMRLRGSVVLIGEASNRQDRRLERYFKHRAGIAGAAAGALSLATLAVLHDSDVTLYHQLTGRALPLVVLGACGVAVIALLAAGRRRGLRVLSATSVAAVVWGWGVAQYLTLLPRTGLTLALGSAPHATIVAIIAVSIIAVGLVVPAFVLLFVLHGRQRLDSEGVPTMPP